MFGVVAFGQVVFGYRFDLIHLFNLTIPGCHSSVCVFSAYFASVVSKFSRFCFVLRLIFVGVVAVSVVVVAGIVAAVAIAVVSVVVVVVVVVVVGF